MAIKVKDLFHKWIDHNKSLKNKQKELDSLKNVEEYKPKGSGVVYSDDIENYLAMKERIVELETSIETETLVFQQVISEIKDLFSIVDFRPITTEMIINNHNFLMKGEFVDDQFTLNSVNSY